MTTLRLTEGSHYAPLVVENIAAMTIRGRGIGQTFLRIDGEWAVEMRGKVGSLEVTDLSIVLNGKGTGIGCVSGTEVDRFRAKRVEVSNGATGISLNADLGGHFRDAAVEDCWVHDMPGTVPGSGYGIHAANAETVLIARNLVERCGRHSIYHARTRKRTPGAFRIVENVIRDHRANVIDDGAMRCALVVSRSCGGIVANNQIINPTGGGMELSPDNTPGKPWPADSLHVTGNQFFGRKGAAPYVLMGEQQVPSDYVLEDVMMTGNYFDTVHDGTAMNPDILILNGRHIRLANYHRHRGSDGNTQRALTIGDARFAKTTAHLSDIDARGSHFVFDDMENDRAVTLDGPARYPADSLVYVGVAAPYIE